MNALDHGCRANVLVLPTEEFGQFETDVWNLECSLRPATPQKSSWSSDSSASTGSTCRMLFVELARRAWAETDQSNVARPGA